LLTQYAKIIENEKTNKSADIERELFEQYLPLVNITVQRIKANLPAHVESEDLVSAGIVGLLDAIRRYDPDRKESFTAYVALKIKCAVLNELRGRDFLSRGARRKGKVVEATYERLEKELGREPSSKEVAEVLGMSPEELEAVERLNGIALFSLQEIQCGKEDVALGLVREASEEMLDDIFMEELQWPLVEAIRSLDENSKLVLSLYYVEELTMKEIADVMGLTESRISQIHSAAIRKLRARLRAKGLI